MGGQPGKVARRPSLLVSRLTPEPGDHPDDMQGGRLQELRQVCPRQPNVPTAAEITTPYPLGHRPLHPRPERILGFELRRLLALPCGLPRHLLLVGPYG